jgi:glutathione S-transferase
VGARKRFTSPFLFLVFYGWGVNGGFPMKEPGAYTAWRERMMKRPTVKKCVEMEQKVATS